MTVKAVRVLREADVVFVPVCRHRRAGRAERSCARTSPATRIRAVPFALTDRGGVTAGRAAAWDAAARAVAAAFAAGAASVAFATIGDPNIYCTFTYLAQTVGPGPEVAVATVPGITAMQDLAAAVGTSWSRAASRWRSCRSTAGLDACEQALEACDRRRLQGRRGRQPRGADALRDVQRPAAWTTRCSARALGLPARTSPPRAADQAIRTCTLSSRRVDLLGRSGP